MLPIAKQVFLLNLFSEFINMRPAEIFCPEQEGRLYF